MNYIDFLPIAYRDNNQMDDSKRQEYLRVLYHELGHWFMAQQVGFEPQGIELKIERPSDWQSYGSCTTVLYRQCEKVQNISEYLYHRQLVLVSGAVFEAYFNDQPFNNALASLRVETSNDDYKKLMELLHLSLNMKLATVGGTLDDIRSKHCQGYDSLYEILMKAPDKLAEDAWLIADKPNVKNFIDHAVETFDRSIKAQGDMGSVTINRDCLHGDYTRSGVECLVPNTFDVFARFNF